MDEVITQLNQIDLQLANAVQKKQMEKEAEETEEEEKQQVQRKISRPLSRFTFTPNSVQSESLDPYHRVTHSLALSVDLPSAPRPNTSPAILNNGLLPLEGLDWSSNDIENGKSGGIHEPHRSSESSTPASMNSSISDGYESQLFNSRLYGLTSPTSLSSSPVSTVRSSLTPAQLHHVQYQQEQERLRDYRARQLAASASARSRPPSSSIKPEIDRRKSGVGLGRRVQIIKEGEEKDGEGGGGGGGAGRVSRRGTLNTGLPPKLFRMSSKQ